MAPDRIAELRAIEAQATPGPWRESPGYSPYGGVVSDSPVGNPSTDSADTVAAYGGHLIGESIAPHNRTFISAARTALPEALDAIERVRALEPTMPYGKTYFAGLDGERVVKWADVIAALDGTEAKVTFNVSIGYPCGCVYAEDVSKLHRCREHGA